MTDAMLISDVEGNVIDFNDAFAKFYKFKSKEECLRKFSRYVDIFESYFPDGTLVPVDMWPVQRASRGETATDSELIVRRKDTGETWIVSYNFAPIHDKHSTIVGSVVIARDITERKKEEETLAKIEIARKQEIHHRIKNNLQVISSLLELQAEKFREKKNIEDSQVMEAFKESQNRVISMALIHEELHKGERFDTLNFSLYVKELAENLFLTYRLGNKGISLDTDIEEGIFFDMDVSVPLGIIINELVSNSLKHAFSGRDKGEIRIKLHREESGECKIEEDKITTFILSISDNGVGIPEDLNIEDLDRLGLQLVVTLADQLDGELELKRDNGTEFIIRLTV